MVTKRVKLLALFTGAMLAYSMSAKADDKEFQNRIGVKFNFDHGIYSSFAAHQLQTTETDFEHFRSRVKFGKKWSVMDNAKLNLYVQRDFHKEGDDDGYVGADLMWEFDVK